ncbi:MAG: hypothetical protein WC222_00145 [Parachlamydiales bacterium]|jgi:hypothetical protein
MSDNNIGDRTSHILNQWQVNQAEEQQEQQQVKQQVIKDQLMKADIAAAPVIATYTQDAHIPKLLDPAPQNSETEQEANGNSEEGSTESALNKGQLIMRGPSPSGGEPRLPFNQLSQENRNLNENALKQFAQQNGLDPGSARIAYFFAKANPNQELASPFNALGQTVSTKSATSEGLKQSNFNKLLNGSGNQLQELANKLGVTPDQARQLVNQAFVSGQSDNPDVQEFVNTLGSQADAESEKQVSDQTFNRALNGSSGSIETLAKQLGKTPEEVKEMVVQARDNPDADLPPEVKTLARNVQLHSEKLSEEATVDPKSEFTTMINSSEGRGAEKVKFLAKQLNMSEDDVKQLLQKAADDPTADVPVEIARAAAKLMDKATDSAMDKATEHLAGQLLDGKIAAGGDKIASLAKKLGISEEEAKALLQKGLVDPDSVPKSVMKLLKEMMQDSKAEAFAKLSGEPTQGEMDSAINSESETFFKEAMGKMGLSPDAQNKVLFAKNNPQLADQLDPDIKEIYQNILASSKEGFEENFGIPKTYQSSSLTVSLTDNGTESYDNAFENSLNNLRSSGQITDKDVAQLRQLHYNPNSNVASTEQITELFKQIEGEIIPQLRTQLGAPDTWNPKPGLDRFGAVMNGELAMVLEKAIGELKENGTISKDQAQQIQKQLAGGADAPEELQNLIKTILGNALTLVSAKYGVSPGSLEIDAPLGAGKLSPDVAGLAKSSLHMADEVIDNFKQNIKAAKDSPLASVYLQFLKLTREALQSCKEYLFTMNAGDSKRAKNMAVTELSKQMNRLEQMKRQFAERDAAIEKMEGMGILMIFLMIIMAVIMIILAVILIGGIVGLIVAVIIAIMEVINISLQAAGSPAAEAFSYVTMAVELLLSFVQLAMAPMKAAMTAAAKAISTATQQGAAATMKAVMKAVIGILVAVLSAIVKAVFEAMGEAIKAIGKAMKQMIQSLVKALTGMADGATSEAGQALLKNLDSFMTVTPDMVTGGASSAQQARMASISTPSTTFTEAFKNIASRIMERVAVLMQNMMKGVGDTMKGFTQGIDDICTGIADFCKSPVESVKEGFEGLKQSGQNMKDALNINPTKDVHHADGTVTKEINWMNDYTDEAFMKSEGATLNTKMKMILGTGEALSGGGKQLVSGLKDNALAESQAIMLELDAWLAESAEMLKFIRKCINNLIQALGEPMEQIKAISESQSKFWKDMSGIGTGLAQSLQG